MLQAANIIKEIDFALGQWEEVRKRAKYDDFSDQSAPVLAEIVTTLSSTIQRLAPHNSPFSVRSQEIMQTYGPGLYHKSHSLLYGVLKSLKQAYEHNYLSSVQELVHADVFADFLEMAEHLLQSGYKDPAAVLIGGVLEEHLRKLCAKHGVPVSAPSGEPRKASQMNDDLAKIAYDKLQQKGVTYWLDLRNKAAHGKYSEYDNKDVGQLLTSVREFALKFPA